MVGYHHVLMILIAIAIILLCTSLPNYDLNMVSFLYS